MAFVNYNNREITIKIVYYGPALSGKTTCLKEIFKNTEFEKKGKLITLDTDGDRTLFFDFLPLEIGELGDYSIKVQLYTVPGQVAYNTTRKLVLQGSDGIVFVADSQGIMKDQNIESFQNLKMNLKENSINSSDIPLIFQYNKRDLSDVISLEDLNDDLNPENNPFFPTIATTGENIQEGLHAILKMVMIYIKNKLPVFQKDKTVMFSRDEITSTSIDDKKNGMGKFKQREDTEEEILELYSPVDSVDTDQKEEKSDNIFDLEEVDENEISSIEVPELEKIDITNEDSGDSSSPIELKEEDLALDVIKSVGPGSHFLREKHTRKHIRDFTLGPLTGEIYLGDERRPSREVALEEFNKINETHHPEPLPDDKLKELEKILAAADQEAEKLST